jgi:hypothetical protein
MEVTEQLIAFARSQEGKPKWNPYWTHRPDGSRWTVAGRLFQAAEWRRYAGAWDGIPIDRGFVGWPHGQRVILGRAWVEGILRVSKAECIRRAKVNHYLARRIRRRSQALNQDGD